MGGPGRTGQYTPGSSMSEPADLETARADDLGRIDDALRENPALDGAILDAIPGGVVVVSPAGAILRANAEAVRFLGLAYDELTRRFVSAWAPETLRDDGSPCPVEEYPVARCLASGQPQPPMTIGVRQPGGAVRWAVFTAVPVPDPARAGASLGVVVTFLDVTETRRAQMALSASQERLRLLLEHAPDFVFTVDREGRIIYINRTGVGRTPDEVLGRSSVEFAAPDYRDRWIEFQARALAGEGGQLETVSDLGRWYHTRSAPIRDETGQVTEVMFISTDVSESKRAELERLRLETRVQESVRLESLGILAGGMAHDFNNLLVGILGGIDLALGRVAEDAPARPLLLTARQASLRASELTNQLLAYSGEGRLQVEPLDLNLVVREVIQLLTATLQGRCTLELDLLEPLPSIQGDQSQLGRVVMNLVTNAVEAHGQEGRGSVQVRTRVVDRDQARQLSTHGFQEPRQERYVLLEVEDEGAGMDERTRARIFDPFFTTKLRGRGLGLAAVLGIVRGHAGGIGVRSTPGAGTSFRVLLPASGQPYAARGEPSTPTEASRRIEPAARPGACVLVVDDEAHVRSIARAALEEQGFRVLLAADGRAAIELLRAHEREVELVILDLLMPELDGEEALREMRAIRPELRVIVSSGYGEETARRGGLARERLVGFLHKPYAVATLVETVTRALAR